MSEYINIICEFLHIPLPNENGVIEIDQHDPDQVTLLHRIDGNFDINNDGAINNDDKDRLIQASELWEEILSNRGRYNQLFEQFESYRSSPILFEDPFQVNSEITRYVRHLERTPRRPITDIGIALRIFRVVIPLGSHFSLNDRTYYALPANINLGIQGSNDLNAPLRIERGSLLPIDIMNPEHQSRRIANCLEYSHLLVILLREAGIDAHTRREVDHAYIIANLNGRMFKMDAVNLIFEQEVGEISYNSDRESIAMHYFNEGTIRSEHGDRAGSIPYFRMAVELNPNFARAWKNLAVNLFSMSIEERAPQIRLDLLQNSYCCYEQVTNLDPLDIEAWLQRGFIRSTQVRLLDNDESQRSRDYLNEAISYYEQSTRINEDRYEPWFYLGNIYLRTDNFHSAIINYDRAINIIKTSPPRCENSAEIWFNKGKALFYLERYEEASDCFDQTQHLNPRHLEVGGYISRTNLHILQQRRDAGMFDSSERSSNWSCIAAGSLNHFDSSNIFYRLFFSIF